MVQTHVEEHFPDCTGGAECRCKIRLYRRALAIAVVFAVIETTAGYEGESSSLMADALHLLVDSASLIIAIIVASAQTRGDARHLRRIGKTFVVSMLAVFALLVLYDAVDRLFEPRLANGWVVMAVATVGIGANHAQHRLLARVPTHQHDAIHHANVAHIIGDKLISIVVVAGGILTATMGWVIVDPVLSLGIGCWLLWTVARLARAGDGTHHHAHRH